MGTWMDKQAHKWMSHVLFHPWCVCDQLSLVLQLQVMIMHHFLNKMYITWYNHCCTLNWQFSNLVLCMTLLHTADICDLVSSLLQPYLMSSWLQHILYMVHELFSSLVAPYLTISQPCSAPSTWKGWSSTQTGSLGYQWWHWVGLHW